MRVGVVGVGQMGYNHARIYGSLPRVELVGFFDSDQARAAAVAGEFGVCGFKDLDSLLAEGLDAVSIAVSTREHAGVAMACAERGVDILLEKPISNSLDQARVVIKACDDNAVKLMVGYVERFNGVVEAVRGAVKESELISIEITRVGPKPPRINDVGVIIDLATHDIDLLRYLSGREITSVHSLVSKNMNAHEDHALLLFELEGGVSAHINVNWVTPFKVRRVQVAAKDRYVEGDLLNLWASESIVAAHNGDYRQRALQVNGKEPLKAEIEAFLDYVEGRGEAPLSVHDAYRSLEVACGCLENGLVTRPFDR